MRNEEKQSKRRSQEGGFILISSYILIAGLLTTVFSYFSRSFYDFDLAQRRLSRLQALYTAESGAERAIEGMKGTIPVLQPDCGQSNPDTWTPYSNTTLGTEGTYTVRITNDCTSPNQIYWIRSTGTFDNVTRQMRLSVRLTNLANYAIASDHMDPDTYFHRSVIEGPVHVNGPLQIYGGPYFYGRVSSSASEVYYFSDDTASDGYTPTVGEDSWTGRRGIQYRSNFPHWKGRPPYPLLNQPRILFPPPDVSGLKQMAATQVVNQKMWIKFNGDGTYNYSTSGPITETNLGNGRSMPPKGSVMYFEPVSGSSAEPAVVVRGIIDRDITIASTQDIGIDGNLRYECYAIEYSHYPVGRNVPPCSASDPKLTVVSAKNIVQLPETVVDPETLYKSGAWSSRNRILTGAFMALGGGMTVSEPDAVRDRLIGEIERGRLRQARLGIYGSLIEHELKPKSLLEEAKDPTVAWSVSDDPGFDFLFVTRDPRLDLASLPPSMKQAMSIISWEACDGSCS